MSKSNKAVMTARGFRCGDNLWNKVKVEGIEAKLTNSDIVRDALEKRYAEKKD